MTTSAANAQPTATSYDETPYPSASFPQSHPNRLAAMARLFGLTPASPAKARVLELGCADGSNLLPMAEQYPGATFLGIDASQVQIAAGQKALEAAGLKNVELRFQNILDFPTSEGKFDTIIAHGIYSWVPEPVREKLLAICQEHLSEQGVAYVSYNALPGWNMRQSLRDMMLYHTRGLAHPQAKVQQARALLKFLADSVPTEGNAYGLLLKSELQQVSGMADGHLRHDILGEVNAPVYLHEFVAHASRHGLQYLSEPSLFHMLAGNFPDAVRDTLAKVGNNIIAQEQYMDFLRNRTFRQTLLCRAQTPVKRKLGAEMMPQFAIQSLLRVEAAPVNLAAGVAVGFATAGGAQITTADPFLKAVFQQLMASGARAMGYADLLAAARAASRPHLGELPANRDAVDEATLASNLMNLYTKGFVELWAEPVAVSLAVTEKPQASALTRYQALNARFITNRVHQPVPVDVFGRHVVEACDGTRTLEQIFKRLAGLVKEGKLQVAEGGQPVTDDAKLRALLLPRVEAILKILAQNGFFAP